MPIPRISDALWQELAPLIAASDPPAPVGRHRVDMRPVLEAILYRLALGCSWNRLPPFFPHASSVYRTYRRWLEAGLLEQIVERVVAHHDGHCNEIAQFTDQPISAGLFPHTAEPAQSLPS